jgi:predicted GNAT family N-acyltransferase
VSTKIGSQAEQLEQAFALRRQVFAGEQGIPAELDQDGQDPVAYHVFISAQGTLLATGRVILQDDGEAMLSRIAVRPNFRGQGFGKKVVQALERCAVAAGAHSLCLHPHKHLETFYQKLGFVTAPGTDSVAGHQLIIMRKDDLQTLGSEPEA